jgi:hypothetical protein
MNVTFSLDEELLVRASAKAREMGKSLDQLVSDFLKSIADGENAELSIKEFERLSAKGHSQGWRFNREETHERR